MANRMACAANATSDRYCSTRSPGGSFYSGCSIERVRELKAEVPRRTSPGFPGTVTRAAGCLTTKGGTEAMTNERIPNDPYDPPRSGLSDDNFRRPQRFDNDLQVDPELQEGPASSSKIALFAVGLALILGAVFYGLNNTSVKEAQ